MLYTPELYCCHKFEHQPVLGLYLMNFIPNDLRGCCYSLHFRDKILRPIEVKQQEAEPHPNLRVLLSNYRNITVYIHVIHYSVSVYIFWNLNTILVFVFSGFFSTFNIPSPFNTSVAGTHSRRGSVSSSASTSLRE